MTPTKIEWTEETWNPVTGCTKVSSGCDNCYAERITNRFGGPGAFDTIVLHPDRVEKPLKWKKPRTVFVNSMSDLFHADVPRDFIAQCFAVMTLAYQHTFQVLTKRPGRVRSLLRDDSFVDLVDEHRLAREPLSFGLCDWPRPNIWLGVSCEDQETADKRIPTLLDTPAVVRFLSCEPLLGPIDLDAHLWENERREHGVLTHDECRIHWIIVGGESGPEARPMAAEWARSLQNQCEVAMVPFFFKQWGGRTPKANGRELDGRTWNEMPGGVR